MKQFFCIIARGDVPIYQTQLHSSASKLQKEDLIQFIIHSALDAVDQKVWTSNSMFFRNVDKFNDVNISAFVTAGRQETETDDYQKFLLLHDQKTDETIIKAFFYEVYELYIKTLMNPFYEKNTAITSRQFDEKVKLLGEKYLGKA